jgi:hypothetical protein
MSKTKFSFFRTFGFDQPCESVHFEKSRLLFHKVENDICIAMVKKNKKKNFI